MAAMKTVTVKQLIVLIAIVVVLVFVATYASITIGGGQPPKATSVRQNLTADPALVFREVKPSTGLNSEGFRESEIRQADFYDFWFENKKNVPLKVKLQVVGCKCTTVDTVLLPEDARPLTKEQLDERAKAGLEWKELARDGSKSVTVPAQALGGVRLNWKGEHAGADTVRAELLAEQPSGAVELVQLQVPVFYVDPVRVAAEDFPTDPSRLESEAPLGIITGGETKSAKFLCWSSSRKEFKLTVIPPSDPCVTCSLTDPLTEDECKKLTDKRGTRVLCGYRLTVTVNERSESGRQMDLGYFRRRVVLESAETKAEAVVTGMVKGEITIGVEADKGLFNLASFPASSGADLSLKTFRST
jgi:hypothetical protein